MNEPDAPEVKVIGEQMLVAHRRSNQMAEGVRLLMLTDLSH